MCPHLTSGLMGEYHASRHDWKKIGIASQIKGPCAAIKTQLRPQTRRNQQATSTPAAARKQWVEKWIGQPIGQWDERERQMVLQDWTGRWKENYRRTERVLQRGTDPGNHQNRWNHQTVPVPEDTPLNRTVLSFILDSEKQRAQH
jgi:hypothetical protein